VTNKKAPEEAKRILKHWQEAVPNDRLAHLVKDASRAYISALQDRLCDYGIPFGIWSYLRILWDSQGLTQKELSDRAGVMESTTVVAIKSMQSLGYIERRYLNGNRKNLHIFLTEKGESLKSKLIPLAEDTNQISVKGIAKKEIEITRQVLLKIIENLSLD
jgi:DNA-binding MarR family transcriptional regulator